MRKLLAAPVVALFLAGGLIACGKTVVDSTKVEEQIQSSREKETGTKIKSVDCPGDVEVTAGDSFECTIVEAGGKRSTATLKIRNKNADLSLVSIQPSHQ